MWKRQYYLLIPIFILLIKYNIKHKENFDIVSQNGKDIITNIKTDDLPFIRGGIETRGLQYYDDDSQRILGSLSNARGYGYYQNVGTITSGRDMYQLLRQKTPMRDKYNYMYRDNNYLDHYLDSKRYNNLETGDQIQLPEGTFTVEINEDLSRWFPTGNLLSRNGQQYILLRKNRNGNMNTYAYRDSRGMSKIISHNPIKKIEDGDTIMIRNEPYVFYTFKKN